jgi:hypothetical protein
MYPIYSPHLASIQLSIQPSIIPNKFLAFQSLHMGITSISPHVID